MLDWLARRAKISPGKIALVYGDRRWTYADLDAWVNRLAFQLNALGIAAGQHVGLLLPNRPVHIALIHATIRTGAVQVSLNNRLTAEELSWQLQRADCAAILFSEETARLVSELSAPDLVQINVDDFPSTELHGKTQEALPTPFDLDAIQGIYFTSGTAGRPKAAMLTFGNHLWSATGSAYRLGVLAQDRWLLCLPLYHIGGQAIVFRSCLYGTAIELQDGFDVDAVFQSLTSGQTTIVSLVPTMLHRILENVDEPVLPESLRCILLGGAAAPATLLEHSRKLGLPLALTYGLTEASSQVATSMPEELRRKPGTVGKALMFTEVDVVGEEGESLSTGEIGEIVVSGLNVFAGYYRQEGEGAKGILRTGDLGYLDEEGDLWVVNRRADLIVSGGENIYPAEVEAALLSHKDVTEACVVGVQDEEWGQLVAAAVVPGSQDLSEDELALHCRQELASYKLPRLIRLVEKLPRTASGKVQRKAVVTMLQPEPVEPERSRIDKSWR